MKYEKPFLSLEEQAELLISRGLKADPGELIPLLSSIGYYRLSGYLYPFRHGPDAYRDGVSLDKIMDLYSFDHKLRLLTLDAVETIEVYVRTQLTYHFTRAHGPFAYTDRALFTGFDPRRDDFDRWQGKLQEQVARANRPWNREDFVGHFFRKYGDSHHILPLWMMSELMDFGAVLSFFRGVDPGIRKTIAEPLGQPEEVILSWLLSLNTIRNRCAHHARLWNWKLGVRPKLPNSRKFPEWYRPRWYNGKFGIVLIICAYLLDKIGLKADWPGQLLELTGDYQVDEYAMGLPKEWRNSDLWRSMNSRGRE